VLEFDDEAVEAFRLDGLVVPLVRMTLPGMTPPTSQIRVGAQEYTYARSYPIKGHSAVMPGYLSEQMNAGKSPLVIERPERFYVYFAD
jgi:hypothetical protein